MLKEIRETQIYTSETGWINVHWEQLEKGDIIRMREADTEDWEEPLIITQDPFLKVDNKLNIKGL